MESPERVERMADRSAPWRGGRHSCRKASRRQSGHKPSEQGDDDERAERPPRTPLALVRGDGDRNRTSAGGPVARVGALVTGQGANRTKQGETDAAEQCREHDVAVDA